MMKKLLAVLVTAALLGFGFVSAQPNQAGQANFGSLISALNNIAVQITNLEALNDLTIDRVRVVSADNLLRGANIEALNNALNRNNVEITLLQDFLNQSEFLTNFLNNANIAVNDVIAVNVLSGGDVILFTR